MPQTNSSTEEAIKSQSSTLPVAFRSGFLPVSPKTGFFHAKCVSKRISTAFLVVVTLCSITLKVLRCFLFIFATAVANTSSAVALVPRKVLKNAKNRVFATFALKIALFSLKTGAKAHTELQQRKTSLTRQFPVEKSVFSKFSPTMSHLSDTSGHRGYSFTTFFSTSRPDRDTRFGPLASSAIALAVHQKSCL